MLMCVIAPVRKVDEEDQERLGAVVGWRYLVFANYEFLRVFAGNILQLGSVGWLGFI
jgi:hypothetical protein